jgi:Repeat of unknown function (DUF6923)
MTVRHDRGAPVTIGARVLLIALALAPATSLGVPASGSTGGVAARAASAKKRCRTVVKRAHGKKRKVRVCRKVKPKPKPAHRTLQLPSSPSGGRPIGVASGYGSIWVASEGDPLVYRIAPGNNRIAATIEEPNIDSGDKNCGALGIGFDAVWASRCDRAGGLARIDPQRNRVAATISGLGALGLGFGAGSVWAPGADFRDVYRIDPATNLVVARIVTGGETPSVAFDFGSAWAVRYDDGTVLRIDPGTNLVVATIRVGPDRGPTYITTGEGAVWVAHQDSEYGLYRIDPATNAATRIPVSAASPADDWFVTVGGGRVWVRSQDATIRRIDPATNAVTATLAAGRGGGGIAYDFGGVWAAAKGSNQLWRIP